MADDKEKMPIITEPGSSEDETTSSLPNQIQKKRKKKQGKSNPLVKDASDSHTENHLPDADP